MMVRTVFERVENIAGKGNNAGYQNFLSFLQCLKKMSKDEIVTSKAL